MNENMQGQYMFELVTELFPICRSITGEGTRQTLRRIQKEIPNMTLHEVPTGTKVFDWEVPKEWSIKEAYVEDIHHKKLVDFKTNNLHVIGYSTHVDKNVTLEELQEHLYSLPEQPDWIPYVTSYYKERWGFCMSQKQRDALKPGLYHAVIDSELFEGHLTYGELLLPGKTEEEIFLSTYVCHPSMANNELSGPTLLVSLAKWLIDLPNRHYSYRLIWIPETIGSITYLALNLDTMKKRIIAGFNISCVGDDRVVSYIASRQGDTLADRATLNVLHQLAPDYLLYSFLQRGSDERQYNAPGVDLPVCCICRSKYGEYPEYHTSADDLTLISKQGLQKSFDIYSATISAIENNRVYKNKYLCEPQLGKRNLYPTESYKDSALSVRTMMNFLAYADGKRDLIDISNTINVSMEEILPIVKKLKKAALISEVEQEA